MGKLLEALDPELTEWIQKQKMFWVATAPLSGEGHVNLSPKGIEGTFHIESSKRCWYEDLSGSGVETIAHLRENGRITIMFQAFSGAARIVRVYGIGTVHEFGTPEFERLLPTDKRHISARSAIVIDIHRVSTVRWACGWGVPKYIYQEDRTTAFDFFRKYEAGDQKLATDPSSASEGQEKQTMKYWWTYWNLKSIDGLPGILSAHKSDKVPGTTRPHRFRGPKNWTDEAQLEAVDIEQPKRFGLLRREAGFIVGIAVGVVLTLGSGQLANLVSH
ncbi:hypothetical protein EXIGLDRAFT_685615 [Exidia glandulosa HHB12029]|uniref:Pyridoxamine 5'-phosphate oxidase N-terminal domain-containing protein n=1 Tax=Exidia glandulosa HHB12029 TaxID=1314781 RepID=A0A165C3W0_EXIGL|nr:hypothetical protein EXIGLDRAFT_685615 [Exidia glandulosa HHB12029]